MACVVALALVSAPLPQALRGECDLCPPTCPMHRHHESGEPAHQGAHAAMPKCHGAPAAAAHHGDSSKGPRVTRPPCGNHAVISGRAVPPMILPDALPQQVVTLAERNPSVDLSPHARLADPPDTRPPIRFA